MEERDIVTFDAEWSGIGLAIIYEANWLNSETHATAHLEIRSIAPEKISLPITETGYRSHFTAKDVIEAHGGPVAFVLAWIDAEAKKPEWKQAEMARKQLSLF